MQDARAGRHPLHVARADQPASAGRVPVLDFALIDDGHGLEAAVRMHAHAARLGSRLEAGGACVVQQQKGAQSRTMVAVAEQRAHGKAVAHPMGTGCAVDAEHLLEHLLLLGNRGCRSVSASHFLHMGES